jgi:hypothetical protein
MNLISNCIISLVIKTLEDQFAKNEPQLKQVFLLEVLTITKEIIEWLESKVETKQS